MRIDAPIFTGSFSLNGSTLQNLSAVSTTGSNTFVGNQNVQGYISASALTGSIDFTNLTNSPTLVSGSSQVVNILSSLNTATASFTPRISNLESKSASVDISITNINSVTASNIARLTNLETKSASVDISITNINSVTASFTPRITNLESKSASVDISISNINSVTASNIARLSNLETKSASVDISITNINSFTASNNITSLNSKTGSYATTGSNTFFGTQTYSGSVYIANDLIVQGSSSIQYISASSVSIGTNIVQLNTANPSVRFAGLTMIDSGSVGGSGSFLYDSLQDEFIFVHRGNGTNVTSSHFVLGPETYDSLGNETYLTCNIITKGTGKEHLVDSCIFDNGTTTCIKNNLVGTGTMSGTTIYGSTVVCSPIGKFTTCIDVSGTGRFYQPLTNSTSYLVVENNRARNAAVYTVTTNGGFYAGTSIGTDTFNYQIYDGVAGSARLTIACTGAATFACSVTANQMFSTTTAAGYAAILTNTNGASDSNGLLVKAGSISSEYNVRFANQTDTTTFFTVKGNGNVGIGISSPSSVLDVQSAASIIKLKSTTGTNSVYTNYENCSNFYVGTDSTAGGSFGKACAAVLWQVSCNSIVFATSNTEQMRITGGGNVGIGTSTPTDKLHILGADNGITICAATANRPVLSFINGSCTMLKLSANATYGAIADNAGSDIMFFKNGNIGIGAVSCAWAAPTTGKVIQLGNRAAIFSYNNQTLDLSTNLYFDGGDYRYIQSSYATLLRASSADGNFVFYNAASGTAGCVVSLNERMQITSTGITTITGPDGVLVLQAATANKSLYVEYKNSVATRRGYMGFGGDSSSTFEISNNENGAIDFRTNANFAMRIASGGDLTIKGSNHCIYTNSGATISFDINSTRGRFYQALNVDGTVTKGGGSFKIDHPLESKKDTYNLYHSFVESPKADLIYRGKVTLINGYATVNIDTAADMSEGTFEVLVKDVQCFTTNENGWNFVKGTISGNILIIESDNTSCNDEISWMVIGERNDKWFRESTMVDENGKTIVEKLKSETT